MPQGPSKRGALDHPQGLRIQHRQPLGDAPLAQRLIEVSERPQHRVLEVGNGTALQDHHPRLGLGNQHPQPFADLRCVGERHTLRTSCSVGILLVFFSRKKHGACSMCHGFANRRSRRMEHGMCSSAVKQEGSRGTGTTTGLRKRSLCAPSTCGTPKRSGTLEYGARAPDFRSLPGRVNAAHVFLARGSWAGGRGGMRDGDWSPRGERRGTMKVMITGPRTAGHPPPDNNRRPQATFMRRSPPVVPDAAPVTPPRARPQCTTSPARPPRARQAWR